MGVHRQAGLGIDLGDSRRREPLIVIVGVHLDRQAHLTQVVDAQDYLALLLCPRKARGSIMLARMPMMAITTRSSIKVNPPVVRGIPEIPGRLGEDRVSREKVIGVFTLVKRISIL